MHQDSRARRVTVSHHDKNEISVIGTSDIATCSAAETTSLSSAIKAIQGTDKGGLFVENAPPHMHRGTVAAYEADE